MISKAAIRAGTKAFGKSKSKSLKRYKTQFETTGDYGQPSVRNVLYRSRRGLKAQRKYMDKKFKSQGSSKWGTFPLSKSKYKDLKKSERKENLLSRPQRKQSVKFKLATKTIYVPF
tara:strand:+ start:5116 stop:5463 length:348 start_codon:yes stop_codon:yes gene_type:complete